MGRIKKAAGPKHEATLSPALATFVAEATRLPLAKLPAHLQAFPLRWPFPRGDLYHWIPLLDRFDAILEHLNRHYSLDSGPQTRPFTRALLEKGISEQQGDEDVVETSTEEIDRLGFGNDGDRILAEDILVFSTLLIENCGNRSLYSSSERLGDLLNTTSLSLLTKTLRLAVRLAQRYHASRQRGANANQQINNVLLASHYNIDLEHVQKLANPFARYVPNSSPLSPTTPTTTASGKGKEKTLVDNAGRRKVADRIHPSDLYGMAKDERHKSDWQDRGSVSFTYYQTARASSEDQRAATASVDATSSTPPVTPAPTRRTSGLSRPSRLSTSEDSPSSATVGSSTRVDETVPEGGMRTLEIPYSRISSTALEKVLELYLPEVPKHSEKDLLCRLRVAYALSNSLSTRRQIIAIRILAITNLAYIHQEPLFQQKILQQDSDEPRRLQLPYQLADLIHPPGNGQADIPLELKTIALGALEALSKHKSRASDVCNALNVNVNHGVLLYILRKTVKDLAAEDMEDQSLAADEWRDALCSLLEALPSCGTRTAESMVAAGLFDVLIELLTLRTTKAERNHPKVLIFLNTVIYTARDAFQTFANSKGLDTISDLIAWEVSSSLERAQAGDGLPDRFRNHLMDYQIPYFQQQTLRWAFKFVNHMMSHGNTNFDRLLRNLVDSPQLLSGLLSVISNGKMFGANVWSGAVNILSSFIHNEPTSYAVIAEAGLSRGLLEAITLKPVPAEDPKAEESDANPEKAPTKPEILVVQTGSTSNGTPETSLAPRSNETPLAQGILAATDAIVTIPHAFGAICLNTSGLDLFLKSGALESFFEIFESPDHVKSLTAEIDLPRMLGNSFDELVRHHPRLKSAVMGSVVGMLSRVASLCRDKASSTEDGAKMWGEDIPTENGRLPPEDQTNTSDEDVDMSDVSPIDQPSASAGMPNRKVEKATQHGDLSASAYINVAVKFLAGFFENASLCQSFIEAGGFNSILNIATLPSLPYDFNNHDASQELARVVHMLIEQKPHLVLPSLLKSTQDAVDEIKPLIDHKGRTAFFDKFTQPDATATEELATDDSLDSMVDGIGVMKTLVRVHTLCNMLCETFATPPFSNRPTHTVFTQLNLTDMYVPLIESLGRLHRVCIWEEIQLQKHTRDPSNGTMEIDGENVQESLQRLFGFGPNTATHNMSSLAGDLGALLGTQQSQNASDSVGDLSGQQDVEGPSFQQNENTRQSKNIKALRFLLSQIPSSITPFFQGLGKALVTKRRADPHPRPSAHMVAEALAKTIWEQLQFEPPRDSPSAQDRYAYWIVVLTSISQLMIDGSIEQPHPQCLTLILRAFTTLNGLTTINEILKTFLEHVQSIMVPKSDGLEKTLEETRCLRSAYTGIRIVLEFYTQITSSRCVVDASQSQSIALHDRDRDQPYYFLPQQFLIELRMAVLPIVRSMWDSDFVDNASTSILKSMIDILRTVLDSEQEQGASRKSDKIQTRAKTSFKPFSFSVDKEKTLKDRGYEPDLVREALYRCSNNRDMAEEYCRAHRDLEYLPRLPVPSWELPKERTPSPPRTQQPQQAIGVNTDAELNNHTGEGSMQQPAPTVEHSVPLPGTHTEQDADLNGLVLNNPPPPPHAPDWSPTTADTDADEGDGMAMSIDHLLNITDFHRSTNGNNESALSHNLSTPVAQANGTSVTPASPTVFIEDLNEERTALRANLIDRALDVLNVHGNITFELADLITVGAAKAQDATTMRKEIGETLVQSLISFSDDDFRSSGKKIAAYAHLLALVLQSKDFYDATLDVLKENLSALFTYIKIFPQTTGQPTSDDSSPWVGQILLVVEKLLAEDVQPQQIKWIPPQDDDQRNEEPTVEMTEPLVSFDLKLQLFEAIMTILSRIGKDEMLALSVLRILVIISRNRDIAVKLGEKNHLNLLFLMARQLPGITHDRLHSGFMQVLRHIIEDDDSIRQIMRSEIAANFETRVNRPTDTTLYVRQMYHLVLRSPTIFVEVTNEKLKLQKYDPSQRPQTLTLRQSIKEVVPVISSDLTATVEGEGQPSTENPSDETIKPSTEPNTLLDKSKGTDTKAPTVEHPDGVIHFILSQLLSFKDVEDKDSNAVQKDSAPTELNLESLVDVEMANVNTPALSTPSPSVESGTERRGERSEFKPEQHPFYVYRCFLLQCLNELLNSYNRCKVEFLNFSRKADPKASTPLKPRSAVLNYILNTLIPVGTLNVDSSIGFQKKTVTSKWASSAVVSLCMRTGERGYDRYSDLSEDDQEPELLFVRKFVLEHALKAYKDANASTDMLDVKYSRMLCIADLFYQMLTGRLVQTGKTHLNDIVSTSQKEIAKIMFEKNFITALTGSIADIDLNFPGSKRVIKYILKPLKVLTLTAIHLSQTSSITTTPGQTDDDEISTASSVSDIDTDREETPDLFRHSTLGMLEPGREEESSSESSDDEEMYDDEYDEEGMEYEEEMERDGDEVISDEDEEIEGASHLEGLPGNVGMDVELVIDGEDEPTDEEDPDDSDDMDEMDEMDEGEDMDEMEIIDEINGDDENASLGDENEGWQDEDDEAEDYGDQSGIEPDSSQGRDHESAVRELVREMQNATSGLPGLDTGDLDLDIQNEVYMDEMDREEDEAEDDGEDDGDDDEPGFPAYIDEDDGGVPEPSWGWDAEDEPVMPPARGHHHHHARRGIPSPWTLFPPGTERSMIVPTYRTHRGVGGTSRGTDDGTNPLLQRHSAIRSSSRNTRIDPAALLDPAGTMSDWVHAMTPDTRHGGPVSFVNNIISAIGQGAPGFSAIGGPHGALHFHIAGNGSRLPLPREIQSILGLSRRPPPEMTRSSRDNPSQSDLFLPVSTVTRWEEEARLLFGSAYNEKTQLIINSLLRVLVPPAIEEEKVRKEQEAEAFRKAKEREKKLLEEERLAKEKAEKEAQEKKEREEREADERAAAEAEARQSNEESNQEEVDPNAMEGVEATNTVEPPATSNGAQPQEQPGEASSSQEAERVRATFRGREVDITGLGIDLEYLDALPEDLREEVLMQQLAQHRSEAAAAGEEPSEINHEFLEALPPEIREELLQQEAQDRRRREREENRRRTAVNGGPTARAEEMDPADFLASLDPHLRQAVLMEQDDEVLAQLPEAIAAEARALGGDRLLHRWNDIPRLARSSMLGRPGQPSDPATKKAPRRQVIQMLDKSGVATLLRLMFIPQQGSARQTLNEILHNVSQNRQNRAEVISLLLSILQDGSADVSAVERGFQHLSLRAKQPALQKTPLKRTLTGQMSTPANAEMTPLMVIQQCLNALVHLTEYNPHNIPSFFLTEHETQVGMKSKFNKKGKAKETRASKFALNALLGLLDRDLIMESSTCMEQLSALLQIITHPLTMLLRNDKPKAEEQVPSGESNEENTAQPTPGADENPSNVVVQQLANDVTISGTSLMIESTTIEGVEQSQTQETSEPSATSQPQEATEDDIKLGEDEKPKKQRNLTPPVVPEYNLRLVVNILAARECSAKTFRDTLSTINNLSAIPGAKEIFGNELVKQAQDLGESILHDLDELVVQVRNAETGIDVHGMALSKFSPSSSDQAKLLRVLTALDYLFDPKRNGGKTTSSAEPGFSEADLVAVKDDLLTTLYENSTFGPLWAKLSECLSAIRQRENMLNIATVLLPLVEALMVVCKNTTLKDIPLHRIAKDFAVTSPPPESGMESLFFRFTEDHRKILNDLVRHNPRLMSGTFSLLVKNPKVLEFDNKRNYFTRRLHSRSAETRHPQPPLQLSVRRDQVFMDSFRSLYFKSGDEMKYGKLSIRFHGEEGVDAGGVTREWFQVMSRQMFDPNYALFVPVASDRTTFHPNRLSGINKEHITFFKFIGRVIGKALYEGRALDCHFSRAVYKRILGKPVSIKDMETLDLDYYKSLLWMLENDITDIITETFSIETDQFGAIEIVDLIENGRNVPVTEENKQEYIQLVVEYRLTGSVKEQLEAFLKGFHDVVPAELISIFDEQELELLISGLPDIDVDDWKNNTEYHNYSASSAQIQWFWRAVRSFDKEERAKLLQFVTGTSKVPLNGFKELEGMNGFNRFNIHRDYGNKDRLPSSHTCFNQLDLPEYESYETLRHQVYTAITAGSEYFGFA